MKEQREIENQESHEKNPYFSKEPIQGEEVGFFVIITIATIIILGGLIFLGKLIIDLQ